MVFLAFIYTIMFVFIEIVSYLVTKAALRQSMRLILRPNSEDASRGFWTSSVFFRHHYLVSAKISKAGVKIKTPYYRWVVNRTVVNFD